MRLENLANELQSGTTIQRERKLRTLIGVDVQVTSTISDVKSGEITLNRHSTAYPLPEVWSSSRLTYGDKQFGGSLLSYSRGDDVKLTARVRAGSLYPDLGFELELVSISKIGTTEQSRQTAKRNRTIVTSTLIGLLGGSIVGIAAGYALKWFFGVPVAVTFVVALVIGVISELRNLK